MPMATDIQVIHGYLDAETERAITVLHKAAAITRKQNKTGRVSWHFEGGVITRWRRTGARVGGVQGAGWEAVVCRVRDGRRWCAGCGMGGGGVQGAGWEAVVCRVRDGRRWCAGCGMGGFGVQGASDPVGDNATLRVSLRGQNMKRS